MKFGFFTTLGALLIVLKIMGVIAWPWIWVTAPIWVPLAAILMVGITTVVIVGIVAIALSVE